MGITRKACPSFSIIELMIVLAAISTIAIITLPQFIYTQKQALIHDLEQLAMICSYLQQKAIASRKAQQLIFHPAAACYTYPGLHNKETHITLSSNIMFGFIPGVKGPPGDPTKPITAAITFEHKKNSAPCITFFNDGKTSLGTAYLTNTKKKYMGALTCGLSSLSYIRKYLYDNKLWIMM